VVNPALDPQAPDEFGRTSCIPLHLSGYSWCMGEGDCPTIEDTYNACVAYYTSNPGAKNCFGSTPCDPASYCMLCSGGDDIPDCKPS